MKSDVSEWNMTCEEMLNRIVFRETLRDLFEISLLFQI